jgi:rare lipoprotein A (peptidoglycan hydrolase)
MPDFKNRIIDLSLAAAKKLDMIKDGTVEVKIYKIKK